MEIVRIHDKSDNSNIVLYLDKNNYFGYKFNKNNTIEKIDKNVFKYFDFLMCSNDFTRLPNEEEYKVILDNETNFKHYFKDSSEDYNMFFLNNGINAINYISDRDKRDQKVKMFFTTTLTILLSVDAVLIANYYNVLNNNKVIDNKKVNNEITIEEQETDNKISIIIDEDIKINTIKNIIYNCKDLTEEEKEYLTNYDFLNDALRTININNYFKYELLNNLDGLNIKSFKDEDENLLGYYDNNDPNSLYAKDYNGLNDNNKDVIAHEFIHLIQAKGANRYNLLTEACAEIISDEYFDDTTIDAYYQQVALTKKLMEIIGPTPIWYFEFTNDFSLIEEKVKPYLSKEGYERFLYCLSFDYANVSETLDKSYQLNYLLDTLYNNIYGKDVKDDLVIQLIDNNDNSLKRYYFNEKYINHENSYYNDKNNFISVEMTLNEAILNNYISVQIEEREYIKPEDVYNVVMDKKNLLYYHNYIDEFKETAVTYTSEGILITGYLNDKFISNVPEQELINQGILLESYYYLIKNKRIISSEDYFNQEYDENSKFNYLFNNNLGYYGKIDDDGVEVFLPAQRTLPTIYERFENIKTR